MARRKKTPETSRITRGGTVAYARKQKPGDGGEPADDAILAGAESPAAAAGAENPAVAAGAESPETASASGPEAVALDSKFDVTDRSQPMTKIDPEGEAKAATAAPVAPNAAAASAAPEAAASAAPETAASVAPTGPVAAAPAAPKRREGTVRAPADTATVGMPSLASLGEPPAMPSEPVPAGLSPRADAVESPTHMPGPKEVPAGSPGDPAPAPGLVPPGDSRSLRRRDATTYEFALIYRRATFVIARFGVVGTRGQWRVVEYPTSAAASHSYAKECSRFVSDGFSDYRE
jgi:hypothetical protein